jgi:tetratricopeptide (TPR) repeat protein
MREGSPWPDHEWAAIGRERRELGHAVDIESAVGFLGFFAGPEMHIVDRPALADPLLARLPAARGWRIGHFFRVIPNGYIETLASGQNEICDERLALYYDKLSLVTRGDLFAGNRLAEIWKLNTGQYDDLIDRALYRSLPPDHNDKGLAEYSIPELKALLRADPSDAYAHYKLGIAEAKRGKIDQAIVHWEAAVREHPNDRCMRRDLVFARQLVESQSANPRAQ